MANQEHIALAKRGVYAISRWRERSYRARARLNLSGAFLSGAKLPGADFSHDDLSNIDLTSSDLRRTNLAGTNLRSAHLSRSQLSRADLSHANLRHATMSRVDLSGSWLPGADLRHADLSFADLSFTDLTGVNLSGANLKETNFSYADLSGALLTEAQLTGSVLDVANLTGVDLRRASLLRARLNRTVLSEATLEITLFGDCDLSQALGLDTVRHLGPSVIGLDTLTRSRGRILPSFLLQAGVARQLVALQEQLQAMNLAFNRVLLVCSVKDDSFVGRLEADLRQAGYPCWRMPVDNEAEFAEEGNLSPLERSSYFDQLVMVCSSNSLESPYGWRSFEQLLHQSGPDSTLRRVVPLALDDHLFTGPDELCAELRNRSAVDFRGWTGTADYRSALERLKAALVAAPAPREIEEPLAPVSG